MAHDFRVLTLWLFLSIITSFYNKRIFKAKYGSIVAEDLVAKLSFVPSKQLFIPAKKTQGRKERFLEVTVYQNQVEKALKVLKRQMTKEGLLKELKRRRFYEKPSVKKKRKQKEAKKKRKAAMRRMRSYNRF